MWILLALLSALCLGFYDVFKKISVRDNDVLMVLLFSTCFGAVYMLPVLLESVLAGHCGPGGSIAGHMLILLKSVIVLASWLQGYFAIKHLPLTIQGPINASRPVLVLVGAVLIFGEVLNAVQWLGIVIGFASLFFISRLGAKEGSASGDNRWIWLSIGATVCGAVSALYDKFLIGRFDPLELQSWYSLYMALIMSAAIVIVRAVHGRGDIRFQWRWSIPAIALFLTIADIAYFYSLSQPGAMISVVSMVRRGSVLVSFVYGVFALHEKNVGAKLVDLGMLLLSLCFLTLGSVL